MNTKSSLPELPPPSLAERIEPGADGVEIMPPCGGQWLREADGGLRPANKQTAEAAGLGWKE